MSHLECFAGARETHVVVPHAPCSLAALQDSPRIRARQTIRSLYRKREGDNGQAIVAHAQKQAGTAPANRRTAAAEWWCRDGLNKLDVSPRGPF